MMTDDVIATLEECIPLAPLHNPANLTGIRAAQAIFPGLPNVAVFDTAFHQTMPEHAYTYAVPRELYRQYGLRRYGFHGTSYRYVAKKPPIYSAKTKKTPRLVIAHLGNGASVAAVLGGASQDTSMGLTPLEGLVMGTRSGDIDPGVYEFIENATGMNIPKSPTCSTKNPASWAFPNCPTTCAPLRKKPPKATKVPNSRWKFLPTAWPNTSPP
jgi:acetate kinase